MEAEDIWISISGFVTFPFPTSSIVDGAICSGQLEASNIRLRTTCARLLQTDASLSSSTPTSDLVAERDLLQALANVDEAVVRSDSTLNARVQRSNNSSNMFDATLRAMTERRSDRMDEASLDVIKADAQWQKATMEKAKAEAERDALADAMNAQATLVVALVGMVARCSGMMDDASRSLRAALEEQEDPNLRCITQSIVTRLQGMSGMNIEAFKALLGHDPEGCRSLGKDALTTFSGYSAARSSAHSVPPSGAHSALKGKNIRRPSSYGANSPSRRGTKSPRKSLRSSIAPQPYRRPVEKDKEKKSVQWRDEAGQGGLDDRTVVVDTTVTELMLPAVAVSSPEVVSTGSSSGTTHRSGTSLGGSESEWEDEKTEDSFNASFLRGPLRDAGARRPRASRLDPSFLKSKTRIGSTLGSLAECEENISPLRSSASPVMPLGDRSMNSLPELHVAKGKDRHGYTDTARRVPATPRVMGSSIKARRRSNIGPMRSEKSRRRSSMIPEPSPSEDSASSGRRIATMHDQRTPAKRPRRVSLLGKGSLRANAPPTRPPMMQTTSSVGFSILTPDPNASADLSYRGNGLRPTWR